MRILNTLQVKPRRTIRVGLWTGEEQGLFGSSATSSSISDTSRSPPRPNK